MRCLQSIQELDVKRLSHMESTWKSVNQAFGAIFSTLLPGASAKLVTLDGQDLEDGLEVKVAFGGLWKESLSELSGGQRSLVALSLVFALLKTRPAPLYILDEVCALWVCLPAAHAAQLEDGVCVLAWQLDTTLACATLAACDRISHLQPCLSPDAGFEQHGACANIWQSLQSGQRTCTALQVDAALDLSHTRNIGKMIKEQFPDAQFIVVSLKEGMFNNANVIFRTRFVDGSSTVTRTIGGGSASGSGQAAKKSRVGAQGENRAAARA